MTPSCINCANWDSRDNRTGWCQLLTDAMKGDYSAHGVALVQTHCLGGCDFIEASQEAINEELAEVAHVNDLRAEAGHSYPASLTGAPAINQARGV